MKLFRHRAVTFDDYLEVCRQIVRCKTNFWASLSVLAILARQAAPEGWDWSTRLMQAELLAQAMTTEERLDPMCMEATRRKALAEHGRLSPDRVDRHFRHFDEVRVQAQFFYQASFGEKVRIVLRNDPVIQRLVGWVEHL